MKKICVTLFTITFIVGFAFANTNVVKKITPNSPFKSISHNVNRGNIFWEEDFEGGQGEWTFADGTGPTDWVEWWHLSTVGAYHGNSWWMGDEDLGGYTSHRYIVLDTPELALPSGNPTLTFKLNYYVETPGGEPAGYDGWDGCDVRISTDGGSTWDVISGTPAYNCNSLYSFGDEFNEGTGIAGWGASSNGWVDASFDLTAYAGDNVKIRFAFCSDPSYDTGDNPDMFGMKVDNIDVAGVFESDGEGATGDDQMVPWYGGEASGNFWALDSTNPHNGSNAMHCTVQPNLIDELISPEIELPSADEIYVGYWVYCDLLDSDGNGDNYLEDYYFVYVKGTDESTWTRLHYAYNGSLLTSDWTLIDQEFADQFLGWQSGTCDLSDYAGETVQLKFVVQTDDNDDGGIGTGLLIDDVKIYNNVIAGLPPENLTATALEDLTVQLTWSPPPSGLEGWIYWGNNEYAGALGLTNPGEWDVASRFTTSDIAPYVGNQLTTVKFFPTCETSEYTVRIWTGSNAANLVVEVPVTNPVIADWNEVALPTPVTIEADEELWIGYHINQTVPADPNGYSAGYDAGPSEAGFWLNVGGWQNYSGQFNYNWLIQGYVESPDGKVVVFDNNNNNKNRDVIGYNIYHSVISGEPYDSVGSVPAADTSFIHTTPTTGSNNYYVVTAVYDEGESVYSDEAEAYVEIATAEEYIYDDGSAESGYHAGVSGGCLAVRVTPSTYPVKLIRIKFYLTSVTQQMIVRAWDDDGPGGEPGTQLLNPPLVIQTSNLIVDNWNTITLPESYNILITEGDFYVGWFEGNNACLIGLDSNGEPFNRSYQYTDNTWFDYSTGVPQNFMMRAVVNTEVGVNDQNHSQFANLLENYPNPVCTSTTIHYNIKSKNNQKIKIEIYNLLGQLVDTVKGKNGEAIWTPKNLPNGVYFYRLKLGNFSQTKRLVVLK